MVGKYGGPYVKVYRRLKEPGVSSKKQRAEYLTKCQILLEDKPGSLADFPSLVAAKGGNIGFFHYDRSVDSDRVVAEIQYENKNDVHGFLQLLRERDYYSFKSEAGGDK